MCLSSSENDRIEAEDDEADDGDDEAEPGDATASADMIFVKSFTPADFLKKIKLILGFNSEKNLKCGILSL